jgi:hypothetical protein
MSNDSHPDTRFALDPSAREVERSSSNLCPRVNGTDDVGSQPDKHGYTFDEVKDALAVHWGLTLYRGGEMGTAITTVAGPSSTAARDISLAVSCLVADTATAATRRSAR